MSRRPDRPSSGWRGALANLGLVAAGLLAGLLLIEVVLHLYNPFQFTVHGEDLALPVHRKYVIEVADDPKLDPTIIHTRNSLGFRGPELPADFESALSIVAVGGSTTDCFYLSDGKDWPSLLSQQLSPVFADLWLNNAGISGHSTRGHLTLLTHMLAELKPDVILYLVGVNDIGLKTEGRIFDKSIERGLVLEGDWDSRLRSLILQSEVASLALNLYRYFLAARRNLTDYSVDFEALPLIDRPPEETAAEVAEHRETYAPHFRAKLTRLLEDTRAAGILPVLITQPSVYGPAIDPTTGLDLGRLNDGTTYWQVMEVYNDMTRALGAELGVPVIDLAAQLPRDTALYLDKVHYTNAGAEAVAAIVAADLCPILAEAFPDKVTGACGG